MKKGLIILGVLFVMSGGVTLAEGCFHDAIEVIDEAGIVAQGARIRNVACMPGSSVIATLKAGTKVRIIGKTAWTKIVMPDGKIGRIGNSYIKGSDSRSSVPAMPKGHVVEDYCDTTNLTRCPNPSAVGETPSFYTKSGDENVVKNDEVSTASSTVGENPAMDSLLESFYVSLDQKYGDDEVKKAQVVAGVIKALNGLKTKNPKLGTLIEYLTIKLHDKFL